LKKRRLIDWQYVLGLLFLPFLVMGVILLISHIQGLVRYNPAYFTEEYRSRYEVPSDLLADLETALRTGDTSLLAEVQGVSRVPSNIVPVPKLRFIIFWGYTKKYSEILFMDTSNYHRYMQHLKVVDGRYVQVPDGLYYQVNSGKWITTFGPGALLWWMLVILFTFAVWVYRLMAAYRRDRFGNTIPEKNNQITR
jgi:hypothetical protein